MPKIKKVTKQANRFQYLPYYQLGMYWCGGEGDYADQLSDLFISDLYISKEQCILGTMLNRDQFKWLAWEVRCHLVNHKNDIPPDRKTFMEECDMPENYPQITDFLNDIGLFLQKLPKKKLDANTTLYTPVERIGKYKIVPDAVCFRWHTYTVVTETIPLR